MRVEFIDPFFEALGRDVRKFFLEARKPSVALRADIGPAYQLRRYAWSAELPLSILTDFEEFAVYDCRIKPKPEDKALYQRQIEMTDRQIDALVHELYGLTEEEIGIVEGGV